MNLNISGRLIAGFSAMAVIITLAVGITIWQVTAIDKTATRIVDLRMPTAASSATMVKDIYASLAALRGYMLTGANDFKKQRAEIWANVDKTISQMDVLSSQWTNPKNVEKLQVFKGIINEFRAAQQQVEDIAKTPREQPATLVLVEEAAPLAAVMIASISKIIDLELQGKGGTGGDRVQILGMVADTRGTLGLGLANIRAYLLTGDEKFATNFTTLWQKNSKRFADLAGQVANLSTDQQEAFTAFESKRTAFSPLPQKMFDIRGSDKWNMANFTLVTEAAPRANTLLNMLLGAANEQGVRTGGMQRNQQNLLRKDVDANSSAVNTLLSLEWGLLATGLVLAAFIALLIIRSIVGPVNRMTHAMGALSGGDKSVEIPGVNRSDEIGRMAAAVQVFKENMIKNDEMAEREREANENRVKRGEAVDELLKSFNSEVSEALSIVSSASTELESSAQTMSTTAEQTSQQSMAVAAAAEEASANVATVASAAEQLGASGSEISRQLSESEAISKTAGEEGVKANEMIQGLSQSVGKIGEVVSMITDIADQTNLLALNATIEAARAGDAGKGFAVVASEVKNLANQTAKATEEISKQIDEVQNVTEASVSSIGNVTKVIDQMSSISSGISAAISEQGAAVLEISMNVQEASAGTSEVTENISGVSQAAGETGSAANEVLKSAQSVAERSDTLRQQVDTFLTKISAA